jgi:hypothetical protein
LKTKPKIRSLFTAAALAATSAFAGVLARPLLERRRPPSGPAEIALALEHATVDVKVGRGAAVLEPLGALAPVIEESATRARAIDLWAQAALQAGKLDVAARAVEERERLTRDPAILRALRVQRIWLYGARGKNSAAEELAASLIGAADDPAIADEVRWRLLAATRTPAELREWLKAAEREDVERRRRLAWAALRVLHDPAAAEPLFVGVERAGQRDASLYAGLLEADSQLGKSAEVARVAAELRSRSKDDRLRNQLELVRARALAEAGDTDGALAALVALLAHVHDPDARLAARTLRFELLDRAGRLEAELARTGDRAVRAWVALEVQHDYALAARLYAESARADPDSPLFARGLEEARRRRDLAEREALYQGVLEKDPADEATREKLLAAAAALGDAATARRVALGWIRGKEQDPPSLVALATRLAHAGLTDDAAAVLARAGDAEKDPERNQQIQLGLGDLYAQARHDDDAQRVYSALATRGASQAIRDRAVTRLASLLHL